MRMVNGQYSITVLMKIVGNDTFQSRTRSLFLLQASQFVQIIEPFEKEEKEEKKSSKMEKLEKIIRSSVHEDKSCVQNLRQTRQ
jgi:hypothetical protein